MVSEESYNRGLTSISGLGRSFQRSGISEGWRRAGGRVGAKEKKKLPGGRACMKF